MKSQSLACGLVFMVSALWLEAQPRVQPEQVKRIGDKYLNSVSIFEQDHEGYLWMARPQGIFRYNSNELKQYTLPNQASSFQLLKSTQEGTLLASAYPKGLWKLNPITDRFEDFSPNTPFDFATCHIVQNQETEWFGSFDEEKIENPGLWRYQRKSNAWKRFLFCPEQELKGRYNASKIFCGIAARGKVWLGTWNGLVEFDPITGNYEVLQFHPPENPRFINQILFLLPDGGKGLWCGSWAMGLLYFEFETRKFTRFLIHPNEPISNTRNIVQVVANFDEKHLIVSTYEAGVFLFNIASGRFSRLKSTQETSEIPYLNNHTFTLFRDREKTIWIGTKRDGLVKIPPFHLAYNYLPLPPSPAGEHQVRQFAQSPNSDKVWILTQFGEYIYTTDTTFETLLWQGNRGIPRDFCKSFANVKGEKLIYNYRELYRIDEQNQRLELYEKPPPFNFGICSGNLAWTSAYLDSLVFHPILGLPFSGAKKLILPQSAPIKTNWLVARQGDNAYISEGTKGVFHYVKGKLDRFYPLQNLLASGFNDVEFDARGRPWFLSRSGIAIFDPGTKTWQSLRCGKELFAGEVLAVDFETNGQCWVGSSEGLSLLSETGILLKHLTAADGLPQNLVSEVKVMKTKGVLALGFDNYATLLNHEKLEKLYPKKVVLALNQMQVLGQDTQVSPLHTLDFAYYQNTISFSFSTLSYLSPASVNYAWRLLGQDSLWVDGGSRNFITFNHLPPGKYMFECKASNVIGQWHAYSKPIYFVIHSAWWQTWWFKTTSVFLVLSCGFFWWNIRQKKQQLETEQKLKFNQMLSESEMKALRSQMNPHFVFNSLNSINKYILTHDSDKASLYLTKFSRLMRLILDNSQHNRIPLEKELEALRIYVEMEQLRLSEGFDFELRVSHELDVELLNVPPMMIQPFVENAIWHGLMPKKEKGKIVIEIYQRLDNVYIVLEDNGIGRPKNGASNHQFSTSQGISLTEKRMNLLYPGSMILIEDLKNEQNLPSGTRITLNLFIS